LRFGVYLGGLDVSAFEAEEGAAFGQPDARLFSTGRALLEFARGEPPMKVKVTHVANQALRRRQPIVRSEGRARNRPDGLFVAPIKPTVR
jgi:hypothetical protein